MENLPENA
jgi:homospermidine synthase